MITEKIKKIRWLVLMLQGAIIGTGAILPGVSGGVLCVAFGIYEPMMNFLEHPIRTFKKQSGLFIPIIIGGSSDLCSWQSSSRSSSAPTPPSPWRSSAA